ncbi:2-amino-4-hydroxy-6-hydroxymethyldihydropteridine pyrophosphokinase [Acetobacter orleanensis NRIC 0473]|nr:2-amino-4-hydroxy-6-hydroxymethyldihydropteridine pyrophosphokinase [Acetobacter orleanensis NRIC 0473]
MALLEALQAIETQFGRERSIPNAARTLDLDIITFGNLCQTDSQLTLPHPRADERAFVLLPLQDVAPQWVHPVSGRTLAELLPDVAGQEIRRIQE